MIIYNGNFLIKVIFYFSVKLKIVYFIEIICILLMKLFIFIKVGNYGGRKFI